MSSGVSQTLRGVWGDGLGQLWAVGDNGTVLRWQGAGWNPLTDHGYTYQDFSDNAPYLYDLTGSADTYAARLGWSF